ncbi:hypothetical protein AMAG_14107 [Allomyces macrogynus ATCC 38327]|uniref:Uncharacterized protein n=1 Tax=Allomyces macrogynus (strain ATCC 38327) TaxID=578462 RepID=A0A0L0T4A7_ALLM3|nr:hypothetical protein AMAG_14107 [Allomyces macrogynus ATCC 38327]|eukprot:KNE69545.1 hypothetical protein AMAG_14107 [Allomyces macrogynus ATCC 38327]
MVSPTTTDPPLPFCVSGRRVEHPSVTAAAAAARAAADHAARVAADALAAQQAALRAGLPRFAQAVETLDEQLQHIDVLKRAHGLIGKAHGGFGALPAAERVEMLEFLVHRGRQEGKGESLDQIIEQVLWEMRRDGEAATVHRAADAEREAAIASRRALPPRAAWRGSGVDVLCGQRTPARDLASDATSRTCTTKRSSTEPAAKRAPAGTRSLPTSPQQLKDRARSDRLGPKETELLLNVISKWRRPSPAHPHSTPSSPNRDGARTSRTPTKSLPLAAKDPSLSPKEQAAVDKVLRLWKKPTTPSITMSRHDSDASLPHSRLVSIGPSRAISRSPSRGEPLTTDYAALMQSAHALLQPAALAKTASASGYLIPAAPPSPSGSSPVLAAAASKALALDYNEPPAVTLHVPTVSARVSRSVSRDLPALRITDEGDDEQQGKGKGSSAAALSAIQQWKSRLKQMKKTGLGEPTAAAEASPTSARTLVNPASPRTLKSPRPSSATPTKGVDRDATNFRARAVPASSLVPKFHQMMQADRDRRDRHHQEYVAMLQTQLTPFKFEYSETLKKRREESKASQQELEAKLAREQAKLDRADAPSHRRQQQQDARDLSHRAAAARPSRRAPSPPPDVPECTFHPHTNSTIPDFSRAQEEHAAQLAARKAAIRARLASRHITTPFPGVEAHQRLLEDRKRKTLAKVRAALSPQPVKRSPVASGSPPPEPKPTRSSTLKVQARIRAQEERDRREKEEREERGVRAARRAAVQRQVQAALEEEARMKEAKGETRVGGGSPSSKGEERYRQFLEDMEMRVMARPFAFQKADLESRAKKLVHESVGSIMAKHGVDVNTLKPLDPARETVAT